MSEIYDMSSRFSRNSEAFALEFLEKTRYMHTRLNIHSNVLSVQKKVNQITSMLRFLIHLIKYSLQNDQFIITNIVNI